MSEQQRRDSSKDRVVSEDVKKPVWSTEDVLMNFWEQVNTTEPEEPDKKKRTARNTEKEFKENEEDTQVFCVLELAWCCQS